MSIQFRRVRHQANLPVTLQCEKWVGRAQFMDLNEAGARLAVKGDIKSGEKVTMVIADDRVTGMVRWVGEGRIGVAFVPKLSPAMVSKLRFGSEISKLRNPRYDSSNLRELR